MKFTIYSKEGCPYCYRVKTAIELCGHEFEVVNLDEDFTRLEFYTKFGQGSTFPQVITEEKHLGGCTETIRYLRQMEKNSVS
jgi:glutaredoxin 3